MRLTFQADRHVIMHLRMATATINHQPQPTLSEAAYKWQSGRVAKRDKRQTESYLRDSVVREPARQQHVAFVAVHLTVRHLRACARGSQRGHAEKNAVRGRLPNQSGWGMPATATAHHAHADIAPVKTARAASKRSSGHGTAAKAGFPDDGISEPGVRPTRILKWPPMWQSSSAANTLGESKCG